MRKLILPVWAALLAATLLTGCLNLDLGSGSTTRTQAPTLGQQLVDLQKAKEAGAISDSEYEIQKAKLLQHNR